MHTLCNAPEEADLILFAEFDDEPFQERVRQHPLVRRYREKCFCINERDHTFPFLPGVYTSVPKRWHRRDRLRSGFYLVLFQHNHIEYNPPKGDEPFLYSFSGAFYTAPVRTALADLQHPESYVCDTSSEAKYFHSPLSQERRSALEQRYAQLLMNSQFVLCPRGRAPATVRLFDVMRAGRVPVVIADDWMPPEGPDWSAFSVRVAESDVANIPERLEVLRGAAQSMGRAARAAWEEWFAPEVSFHTVVEWCLSIQRERQWSEQLLRLTALRQLGSQPYRYNYLVSRKQRLKEHGRPVL